MSIKNCVLAFPNRPYTGKHGLYVNRPMSHSSISTLVEKASKILRIKGAVLTEDFHCTIMYSMEPIEGMSPREVAQECAMDSVQARVVGATSFGAYFVLLLSSSDLKADNFKWQSLGAKYTHPSYRPHVTLIEHASAISAKDTNILIDMVKKSGLMGKTLEFGPECVQDNSDS